MPTIVIQRPFRKGFCPPAKTLRQIAKHVLSIYYPDAEATLRIVSTKEIQALNRSYRNKDKPTNVLSFRMEIPEGMMLSPMPIGDVVICADIVNEEAALQHRQPLARWAHIVIHGILHLLGHDHENHQDALMMESIEIDLMEQLGFPNPYQLEEDET